MSFDLRTAVHAVIDETDLASPRDIAAKVAESIPANAVRACLAETLIDYVRVEITRRRAHTTPAPSQPSPKVTAIRAAAPGWRRALHDRIHIGSGQWRILIACTYEDLQFAAAERREHAARNAAAAERYDTIAALLHTHHVTYVGDLPETALAAILD